jgi:PIN domain nuclease of toxin-antitoxin system
MRILLDTHVLLWALAAPGRLGADVLEVLSDPAHEVLFSPVSIWEIAIKTGLGRADFAVEPGRVVAAAVAAGFVEVGLVSRVAAGVLALPPHHRDPFDRLLIAQAMALPARLFTADRVLGRYGELVTVLG